jgi:hypothetical protein
MLTRLLPFVLAVAGCATVRRDALPPTQVLTRDNVDVVLRPGDMLFRYVDPKDPLGDAVTGGIIKGSQGAIQAVSGVVTYTVDEVKGLLRSSDERFDAALNSGDPNAVHMAVYLGGGKTAEAFGTTVDDARVNTWDLLGPSRHGSTWRVFRYQDERVARATAEVARRWATGRMTYKVPFEVFVRDAVWGERARAAAFSAARAWATEGGPADVSSMFCSQFAVAAVQSAAARVLLGEPANAEELEKLPRALKLDSVASPVRVYGAWRSSRAFTLVGHLVVD